MEVMVTIKKEQMKAPTRDIISVADQFYSLAA